MALDEEKLVKNRNDYSNELVKLDILRLRIDALLNNANNCIMNIANCSDKVKEMPVNSTIYKNKESVNTLSKEIETWKENITTLIDDIEKRRKELDKLIADIDKKLIKINSKEDKNE